MKKINWTAKLDAQCDKLHAAGLTSEQIAIKVFNDCTRRNAVIGSMYRRGKTVGVKRKIITVAKPPKPIVVRLPNPIIYASVKPYEAKPRDCRWPIGDPKSKDFLFCGGRSAKDKSYCAEHCRIAYVKAPKRVAGTAPMVVQL